MFQKKVFLMIVIFSTLLVACGSIELIPRPTLEPMPLPSSIPSPISSAAWDMVLKQSGGIAGISRALEVHSDGQIIVSEERSGKSVKRQLKADELTKINQLLTAFSFHRPTTPMGCADCFFFDLEIQSGGKNINVQSDQVNLHGSGAEDLINYLTGLMNAMLASG